MLVAVLGAALAAFFACLTGQLADALDSAAVALLIGIVGAGSLDSVRGYGGAVVVGGKELAEN
jgi:hypothetical protein